MRMKPQDKRTKNDQIDPESLLLVDSNATKTAARPTPITDEHQHHNREPDDARSSSSACSTSVIGDKRRMLLLPVYIILVIGVCVTAAFVVIGMQKAHREQQSEFEKDADEFLENLVGRLREFETAGLWVHQACRRVGFSNINETTSGMLQMASRRQEFYEMEAYLKSTNLPYRKIGWAPNITHAQRATLEQESRDFYAQEYPDSESYKGIVGASPDATRPTQPTFESRPAQPNYLPQHYIAPRTTDSAGDKFQDFDMLSSPIRATTIVKAMESYQPRLTEKLTPTSNEVMLAHPGVPLPGEDPAVDKPQAVSLLIFDVVELITRAMNRVQPKSKAVLVLDQTPDTPEDARYLTGAELKVVFTSEGGERNTMINVTTLLKEQMEQYQCTSRCNRLRHQHRYHQERHMELGGRNLLIHVATIDGTYEPQIIFVLLGGFLMLLACVFLAAWFATGLKRSRQMQRVTAAAKAEKAAILVDSAKQMAAAERELNDYVAHEVRNPLAAALTACSFVTSAVNEEVPLQTDEERQSVRGDMQVMGNCLHFINDLLRNMLDLNRAASNQLHIEMTPTDVLLDILEPVASMLYHRAEQYKVRVVCPESSIVILTDRIRLKQIMLNLANNSRKFVSRGFIQLSAEVAVLDEGTDQERSVVRVSVEDSGPGIPVQKRDKLFNKFQSSLDTLNQGTGIGLCLCKNLSQLMGGELYLDEDYKSGVEGFPGARFVVDLQIPPISLKVATAAEDELFDDANVETAPQRLAENRSTKRLSFAEEPQCQQRAHSSGPAEELTGESSARLSSEAGVAAVTPSLIATVHSQTSTKPSSTSMECDLSLPETLKVLVVDDDLIVRKLLLRSIRRLAPGWTAKEASNGETALLMAEAEDYDLIIMDQYMASTEKQLLGTETTRALRSQGCKARICGLSANDVEEAFLAAGANCFMQKPFPCEKVALGREMHRLLATPLVTTTVAADSDLDADVTPLQARVPKTN